MKVIQNRSNKAGAFFAPAILVLIYFLFVSSDIFTTYLVTPNLKFESNLIIKMFKLSWVEIIIFAFIFTTVNSILFLTSQSIFYKFLTTNKFNKGEKFFSKKNRKICIFYFFQSCFYSHLFISVFVSINNFINYIFLYKENSFLYKFSFSFVKIESFFHPHFYIYTQVLLIIIGLVFTAVRVKNIVSRFGQFTQED
jgi:hypothetical protein